jgi:hypothetical protein
VRGEEANHQQPGAKWLYNTEKVISFSLSKKSRHLKEVTMKTLEYDPEHIDYYKNNDFPALDSNRAVEDAMLPPHPEVDGKPLEEDPINQEQEQQVEAWMTDIKAFIRSIDISKL